MNINQQILHNIADNISKGYGKHPILQLECLEWFTCLLGSNKDRVGVTSVSRHAMGADWEDRSACIGQIQGPPARALLTLLVWGFDQKEYMTVKDHLAGVIKPSDKTPKELLNKMAHMVLYCTLYDMWNDYTVQGRVKLLNMPISHHTYSKQMLSVQRQMMNELANLVSDIDKSVWLYRKNLKMIDD